MNKNFSRNETIAHKKGYYIWNNSVYNRKGSKRKINYDSNGYPYFTITKGSRKTKNKKSVHITLHRFVAYFKYGEKIFERNIQVRHLNNNKNDFSWKNIAIGYPSENSLDNPQELRLKYAINASKNIRKFNNETIKEIREYHNKYKSYKKTMKNFSITSSGSLYYILNNNYVT